MIERYRKILRNSIISGTDGDIETIWRKLRKHNKSNSNYVGFSNIYKSYLNEKV